MDNKEEKNLPDALEYNQNNIDGRIAESAKILCKMIVEVDLDSKRVAVLHNTLKQKDVGAEFCWNDYLEYFSKLFFEEKECNQIYSNFNLTNLGNLMEAGERFFTKDFHIQNYKGKGEKSVVIIAIFSTEESDRRKVYVQVRDSDQESILKMIVNQYVYNTCDYFIYLDAKNNRYTMFSGSQSGTPLPPEQCEDYEKAVIEYARTFVVEEDQEHVIREMHLPRVLEELEKKEIHSFFCGIDEGKKGYRRKRLDYRYYDKKKQMILLSRTDITDTYMEEKRRTEELEAALLRAQTDPMTKLWNFRATMEKVTGNVQNTEEKYAFLFLDLDNFKEINDAMGHAAGDQVLTELAKALKESTRSEDIVGRVGGDEFVILVKMSEGKQEIERLAEKICEKIRSVPLENNLKKYVSGSIGIAFSPEDGQDYYTLMTKADRNVYYAKAKGKNQYYM